MEVKVLVAAHKEYWMPSDGMYLPVHVGRAISKVALPFQSDAEGENISAQNGRYSELTGVYWAWKNLDADYIGLAHYRRHFAGRWHLPLVTPKKDRILTGKEAAALLQKTDVILPKKRRYVIENLYDHYAHTHDGDHLVLTRQVIARQCPEYLRDFDALKTRTSAHMFNMFIMKREVFEAYCGWLFPILARVECDVDTTGMNDFQQRFPGRISELLLDVWLTKNGISYREVPCVQLGKTNWATKIRAFLAAKFKNRQYRQSF